MNFSQTSAEESIASGGGDLSLLPWYHHLELLEARYSTTENTDADNEFFKKDPDHQDPEGGLQRCFSDYHYEDGHNWGKKERGETLTDDDEIIINKPYKNWAGDFCHYNTNTKEIYYSCRNSLGRVFQQTEYVRINKNYPRDYNLDILNGWSQPPQNHHILYDLLEPEEEEVSPHIESYLSPQLESYYTAASYINNPEPERNDSTLISLISPLPPPQRMETWSYYPQIHDDDDDDDIEPIESLKSINDMSSIEFKQHIKYIKCSIKSKHDISKMTSEEYSEYIQELREDY